MKRMKQIFMGMAAMACLAFVACSNDNDMPEGGGGEVNKGEAWLSLSLSAPKSTRALNNPDKNNGTSAETNITTAKAIFFKYTGSASSVPLAQTDPNSFVVVDVVDLTTDEIGTLGQGGGGTAGDAFKVSKDVEYLLFVANPVKLPTIVEGASTFADVNKAIQLSAGELSIDDNFLMTNAKGDLEPSASDTDPQLVKLTLKTDASDAESNPAKITLDRAVAKVRVLSGSSLESNSAMEIDDLGWVLNVTNRYSYPVSQRTKTFNSSTVWSDPYGLGSYRIDPNYNNTTPQLWDETKGPDATNQSVYAGQYNYYYSASTVSAWNVMGGSEYCLENTQNKDGNVHAYTTQVLLKAVVNPKEYQMPNGTPETAPASGHDVIKIGTGYYTPTTLGTWIEAGLTKGEVSLANAINVYFTGLQAAGVADVEPIDIDITTAEKEAETIDAFKNMLGKVKNIADAEKAAAYGTVSYYAGGVCYYKIMIKHDNNDKKGDNELGEFGVVRNSVYDVTINSINNIGYPVIPNPDPTIPDEEDDYFLAVEINVNPWTWYSQSVDL